MLSASFEESLSKEARKLAESFDEGASMTSFRFSQPSPSPSFQATVFLSVFLGFFLKRSFCSLLLIKAVTATAASPYTPVPYTAQVGALEDEHKFSCE